MAGRVRAHLGAWRPVEFADTSTTSPRWRQRSGRAIPGCLWAEKTANPMWEITDLAAVCDLAHQAGVRVAVDNTVATPVLTRPFEHGVDLVVHSATKYLNGHGDVLGRRGAVRPAGTRSGNGSVLCAATQGRCQAPFEAWLLQRGMRTLFLRVRRGLADRHGNRFALRRASRANRRPLSRTGRVIRATRSPHARWTAGRRGCPCSGAG